MFMAVLSKSISNMVREEFSIQMVMYMKAILKMIVLKAKEPTTGATAPQSTSASGKVV